MTLIKAFLGHSHACSCLLHLLMAISMLCDIDLMPVKLAVFIILSFTSVCDTDDEFPRCF